MEYQKCSLACFMTLINEQLLQFEHQPQYKTAFDVLTEVRQKRAAAEPFLFSFAIDDIVGRIVESNSPADIILEPLRRLLTDLENADDVVIFAGSTTKLQHVVNLLSKLAAAYVYALINACRCASLRDLERGFGWKDN